MNPKHLRITEHRTLAYGSRLQNQFVTTYEGQAHLAGTGPSGELCSNCLHWGRGFSRNRNCPCMKFAAMTGVASK